MGATVTSPLLALLTVMILSVSFSGSANGECEGDVKTEHVKDRYHYVTTSRIYEDGRVFVYETCVENLGQRDLEFKWYIPGPHGWVMPGDSLVSTRRRESSDDVDGVAGCLRYGNGWVPDQADFLPHVTDEAALEVEAEEGCKAVAKEQKLTADLGNTSKLSRSNRYLPTGITSADRLIAPSNAKNASDTLIEITIGTFMVADKEMRFAEEYTSVIFINGRAVRPKGVAEALRFEPISEELKSRYEFEGIRGGKYSFGEEGFSVEIDLMMPKHPVLADQKYKVMDENNIHVATFRVPFLLEQADDGSLLLPPPAR